MKFSPISLGLLALFTSNALAVSDQMRKIIHWHSEELANLLDTTMDTMSTLVIPHHRNAHGAKKLLGIIQTELDEVTKNHKAPNPEVSEYLEDVLKNAVEPLITVMMNEHRVVGALFDATTHLAGEKKYGVQMTATFDEMKGWVSGGMALRQRFFNLIEKEKKANQVQQKKPPQHQQQRHTQRMNIEQQPQHTQPKVNNQPQNVQTQHHQPQNIQLKPAFLSDNGQDMPSPSFEELIQNTEVNRNEMRQWFKDQGWKSDSESPGPGSPLNFGDKGKGDMEFE